MDARELLRRYLEQRRDLGESELVLDSMSVEDALALLGAKAGAPAPRAVDSDATPRRPRPEPPATADWRQAIREAGGAPEGPSQLHAVEREEPMPRRADSKPAPQPPPDAVHVPTTQTAAPLPPRWKMFPPGSWSAERAAHCSTIPPPN